MQYVVTEAKVRSLRGEGEGNIVVEPSNSVLDVMSSYLMRTAVQEWHEAYALLKPDQIINANPDYIAGDKSYPVRILFSKDIDHKMQVAIYDQGASDRPDNRVATLFDITAWPQQAEMVNTLNIVTRHDAEHKFVASDLYAYLVNAKTYYLWLRDNPQPQAS